MCGKQPGHILARLQAERAQEELQSAQAAASQQAAALESSRQEATAALQQAERRLEETAAQLRDAQDSHQAVQVLPIMLLAP